MIGQELVGGNKGEEKDKGSDEELERKIQFVWEKK